MASLTAAMLMTHNFTSLFFHPPHEFQKISECFLIFISVWTLTKMNYIPTIKEIPFAGPVNHTVNMLIVQNLGVILDDSINFSQSCFLNHRILWISSSEHLKMFSDYRICSTSYTSLIYFYTKSPLAALPSCMISPLQITQNVSACLAHNLPEFSKASHP